MEFSERIEAENNRILTLLSEYLNLRPDALSAAEVIGLAEDTGQTVDLCFRLLLAAEMRLDINGSSDDRSLYHAYFPGMAHILDTNAYKNNAYLKTVRIASKKCGKWELRSECFKPFEVFVMDDFLVRSDGRILPQIGCFAEEFSYPAVLENGREWMLITPNEINTMKPAIARARGKVLTYGLGLGYYAFSVSEKPEVESVTVVERDAEVIALFQSEILTQFPHAQKIRIVEADAFDYAEQEMGAERFTAVFTDLWHDVSDGLALYHRMKKLERFSPQSDFSYWIEPTLKCYQGIGEE